MTPWSWKPVSSLLLKVLCHCLDEVGVRVLAFELSFFSLCWSPFYIITGDKNEWFNFVILVINSANLNQCFLTSFEYQLLSLVCLHPLQALYLVFKFIFFWFKFTMNLLFFSLLNFAFTLSELTVFHWSISWLLNPPAILTVSFPWSRRTFGATCLLWSFLKLFIFLDWVCSR